MARKRVYLIRHGQTKGNAEKRYIGQNTDEPLSDKGRAEAERLRRRRDRVFAIRPDRVLSSPMKRAVDTAAILFEDMTPAQIDELTEMDFGRFEGKNYQQLSGVGFYTHEVNGRHWNIEPGEYVVKVGASSQDIRLEERLTLIGEAVSKPLRDHYFADISVER